MTRILGIDPGSLNTGYGIIDAKGSRLHYVTSGVIRLPAGELAPRLKIIFDSLSVLICDFQPDVVSVEQVFMARNAGSALKLGQARGAAIVAAVQHDLPVAEYSAKRIKQSVVGQGGADKVQVQHMVRALLKLDGKPQEDAADALAAALCHAHSQQSLVKMAGATHSRRGRIR